MSKAKEFLKIIDPIMEMANLNRSHTGLPYFIHIRSKEEVEKTPHSKIKTLKVYKHNPDDDVPNFSMTISNNPEIDKHTIGKFSNSVSGKDMKLLKLWISKNNKKLTDFWDNAWKWTLEDQIKWIKTLSKV